MNSMSRPGLGRRDLWVLTALALPLAAVVLPALTGRTYFWGDLLYLHHPWRALPAEMLQRGALPLWNPYIYLGMPLAASMQGAVWYPGTVPFYLFGFETALALFHALHFWLAGAGAYLWLRSIGMGRAAAAAGGAAWMLSGQLVRDLPFLNHLSTLAFLPAFLLLGRRPAFLGLALALSFFSGYPQMLAGSAAAAWLIGSARLWGASLSCARAVSAIGSFTRRWLLAGLFSLALSAALLVPALELAGRSRRSTGIDSSETLTFSFAPKDLVQFSSPLLVKRGEFSPAFQWWKTVYWGILGLAAAGLGFFRLTRAAACAAAAYLLGSILLMLGGSNPLSNALWTHAPLLNYIRYPGNTSFLASPVLMYLIARGLSGRKWAPWAALAVIAELFAYSWFAHPAVPRGYFTQAGPLVRNLQRELAGHRYLLSPLALNWSRGRGADFASASLDLKQRLYGETNTAFHLSAVGNFGEPLVPNENYAVMDHLYSRPGLAALAPWLPWVDAKILLTKDRLAPGDLRYLGDSLWQLYGPAVPVERAYWMDDATAEQLPRGLDADPPSMKEVVPVPVERLREDALRASGNFSRPGWLFLSEPFYPGWRFRLDAGGASSNPDSLPALGAFRRYRVPAGAWTLAARYAPGSWTLGLSISLLSLLAGLGAAYARRPR
ncbi:MAG: hypothetical protein CO113_14330 [Elusimicrobia bacterium CG_4_9_14_3_um_filter_62_55]|nr:MAG: hypothetical protein COR54_18090 [Elusimicrobia bacterium CG22_combo_CG10-13_8_21_14_all_63_91]PJA11502.1 MAG: hypothetical protein COX66_19640 [Elusimicrobia bacterium CG_4_10_14_0_2_um_filter_63_34]PJB24337.1 MAG: hypothetical protein CO113_14330 [Elusimicrobia bacterium CG_4_9_14_3_um_filter_62_55]